MPTFFAFLRRTAATIIMFFISALRKSLVHFVDPPLLIKNSYEVASHQSDAPNSFSAATVGVNAEGPMPSLVAKPSFFVHDGTDDHKRLMNAIQSEIGKPKGLRDRLAIQGLFEDLLSEDAQAAPHVRLAA